MAAYDVTDNPDGRPSIKVSRAAAAERRRLYCAKFGWWQGLKNWRAAYSDQAMASIYLPRHKMHFRLRPGTTDAGIFEDFFLREPYGLPGGLKPKLIIDGGANIGCSSVFFAQKYSGASIIALEPDAKNAALCAENTARYKRVRVIQGALWPRDARIEIESPDVHNTEFRVVETTREGPGSLPALTIPALLEMAGAERVDILKIDIEGGEYDLFAGDAEWITRVDILIIEFHDRFRPGCAREFYRALCRYALDFDQQICGDNVAVFLKGGQKHGKIEGA